MLIGNRVKTHKNSISSNWPLVDEIIRPIPDFHFPIAAFQFRFNISNLSSGWLVSAARWSIQFASSPRPRSNFPEQQVGQLEGERTKIDSWPDFQTFFIRPVLPISFCAHHGPKIRLKTTSLKTVWRKDFNFQTLSHRAGVTYEPEREINGTTARNAFLMSGPY